MIPKYNPQIEYSYGQPNTAYVYYLTDFVFNYLSTPNTIGSNRVVIDGIYVNNTYIPYQSTLTFASLLNLAGIVTLPAKVSLRITGRVTDLAVGYTIFTFNTNVQPEITIVDKNVPYTIPDFGYTRYKVEEEIYSLKQVYQAVANTYNVPYRAEDFVNNK